MDGEQGGAVRKKRVLSVERFQISGNETRLPFMEVNEVGREIKKLTQGKDRLRKER